jgi:hypothetical protein
MAVTTDRVLAELDRARIAFAKPGKHELSDALEILDGLKPRGRHSCPPGGHPQLPEGRVGRLLPLRQPRGHPRDPPDPSGALTGCSLSSTEARLPRCGRPGLRVSSVLHRIRSELSGASHG